MLVYYVFIFFMGLFIGSFYNVIALRELTGESISLPPSHCTSCNHKLGPLDLFPVLSYVFLGGKCRYCKDKISFIYPVGELLTGIAFTIVVRKYGISLEALYHLVFVSLMVIATTSDLKAMIVPDKFVVIGLVLVSILKIINKESIISMIVSMAVPFFMMYLIFILSGDRLGGADVKIYALIGLTIGIAESFGSLFYASISALIIMLPVMIKDKGAMKREIPFFPFITIGVLMTYVYSIYNFF